MLIRTKIFLALITFIIIIFLMGTAYFYFSNKQVGYFDVTEKYLRVIEVMKAASNVFDEQVRAYDYYVYLHENSEKFTFLEKKEELLKKLKTGVAPDIYGLEKVNTQIEALNVLFLKAFDIIKKTGRTRAIQLTEKKILPGVDEIKKQLRDIITHTEKKLKLSRDIAVSYRQKATNFSIIFFGIGIIFLSVMSINMYRTIMNPLQEVEKAAEILGRGNMDYKINIKSKNEFTSIADAFNRMAKDLKEFHLKVTQMGKMVAIGELAGGVAHEINNPLTGILGNAQILLKNVSTDDKIYPVLKKMERAAIRCRDIVADLLDFSRKDKAEVELLNVNKVIDNSFTFCKTEINSKNIELVKEYDNYLPAVKISPRQVQQAFLNIINNAIFAMPEGGKLTVSTKSAAIERKKYVEVKFRDTGHGFDKETARHLFDPFFTTREVGEGTGLGLSLTYRIIKNHNGYLTADSDGPGKGAVFTVCLPVRA